ncbi:pollen allergen Che a 1-like [Iris pallida]|uniref:Pollen allergen Che a 1-like n=1 Tax=Iris pallida TaxID=29817 RepID=A0AAX6FG43_IRIPA|nr:pollen allergen Che a 1-like [Iris pallida]
MANNVRSSCFLLLALFCMFHCSASSHHEKKLSSAIVVGTVNCDMSSFGRDLSKSSHFISGASVAVECAGFRKEIKTNRRGVFRVRLPATAVDVPKGCSVRLIRSNEQFCSMASSSTSAELRLKSKRNGPLQVFSAGPASPAVAERKQFFFPPPIPFLPSPPIGGLPLPPNPVLPPPIPFLPSPPIGGLPLPPNPVLPPPSLLPPVIPSPPPSLLPPVIPSPPPSLLPPFLPTPPPAPFVGIPPLPPLIPPPSMPPPPASIFPPFPPNPLFPGHPPASPPAKTSP